MTTIFITGCSSGFGRATAQLFLDRGWNVVAAMRTPREDVLNGGPDRLRVVTLDVRDTDSVRAGVEEAIGAFGGVDVLVNNAGVGFFSPLETTTDQTIRHLFETNTFGVMAMIRAMVPHMRERGVGIIVNVTSSSTFAPMPLTAVYAASKTAVDGLSEALYFELAPFGIQVKMVEPGYGPGTAFSTNAVALNDESSIPVAYQAHAQHLMGALPSESTSAGDVAEGVFRAVAEKGPTLRFPAGPDSVAIAQKRATLSEEAFLEKQRDIVGHPQR